MDVSRIKQKTIVEQVMEKIKDQIANRHFKINDRIPTENELAEIFGIGRSSVREAMKIFQYLGVLESRTGKGTFVCDSSKISSEALTWSILLGRKDLFELVELRAIIEQASLIQIIKYHIEDPDSVQNIIKDLEETICLMRESIAISSLDMFGKADYEFHGKIIQGSRNTIFINIYKTLHSFMLEEIKSIIVIIKDFKSLIQEHVDILNSVKNSDINGGVDALNIHIERIKERLKNTIK